MSDRDRDRAGLDRREFLRRVALTTAVAGTAATTFARPAGVLAQPSTTGGIPPLTAHGRVRGLAAHRDELVAVGEIHEAPAVWALQAGSWRQVAGVANFPEGTILAAVASMGGMLVAAGAIDRELGAETVMVPVEERRDLRPVAAGTIQAPAHDHPAEVAVTVHGHSITPALFSSFDGVTWQVALDGVPGIAGGMFSAIVASGGLAPRLLAVGARFADAAITESQGSLAVVSGDGRSWKHVSLGGIPDIGHGQVTLLADLGGQLLIGTTGLGTTDLFVAPHSALIVSELTGTALDVGPWRRINQPALEGPMSYVTAGTLRGSGLLAGIDHFGDLRYWSLRDQNWVEIQPPAGLGASRRVGDFENYAGSLVSGGSDGDQTLVTNLGEVTA